MITSFPLCEENDVQKIMQLTIFSDEFMKVTDVESDNINFLHPKWINKSRDFDLIYPIRCQIKF